MEIQGKDLRTERNSQFMGGEVRHESKHSVIHLFSEPLIIDPGVLYNVSRIG